MLGVKFDDEFDITPPPREEKNLITFLKKRGWAKDEDQAITILLFLVGACLSLIVIYIILNSTPDFEIPPDVDPNTAGDVFEDGTSEYKVGY